MVKENGAIPRPRVKVVNRTVLVNKMDTFHHLILCELIRDFACVYKFMNVSFSKVKGV